MPAWSPVAEDAAIPEVDESTISAPVPLNLGRDRIRIATDMSDIVVGRLLLAGLDLESARWLMDSHPAAGKVEAAIDRIDEAIRDIRNIVFDIHRPRSPQD
jgi:signal transduction histidine kinase